MDRKIYDAMMRVEDNIDHPPHTLTSAMPHKIVDALKAAGYVISPADEIGRLRAALQRIADECGFGNEGGGDHAAEIASGALTPEQRTTEED